MSDSDAPQLEVAVMDPAFLHAEEIDHELVIRGISMNDTAFIDRVQLLAQYLRKPTLAQQLETLEPQYEHQVIEAKLAELRALVAEAKASWGQGQVPSRTGRATTLFVHTLFRLRRVMFRDPEHYQDFAALAKRVNKVQDSLTRLFKGMKFPRLYESSSESPSGSEASSRAKGKKSQGRDFDKQRKEEEERKRREEARAEKERKELERKIKKKLEKKYREKKGYRSDTSSSSSSDASSDSPQERKPKLRHHMKGRRTNPVAKWSVRYNGDANLYHFLQEVEEAAEINEVSDEELLRGISALLTGSAKTWYQQKKGKLSSWKAFRNEIKGAFTPNDDDDELIEKLNSIKQDPKETYVVYEARCEELFSRLRRPLSPEDQLKKIMKGLDLYYRSRMCSKDMDSLRTLRSACKKLELDKAHVLQLEKERRKQERKKDDKDIRKDARLQTRTHQIDVDAGNASSSEAQPETATAAFTYGKEVLPCWRCGQVGHFSYRCTEKIFCIVCGAQDTVAERCPNCAKARKSNAWNNPAQRSKPEEGPAGNATGGARAGRVSSPFSVPPPNFKTSTPNKPPEGTKKRD